VLEKKNRSLFSDISSENKCNLFILPSLKKSSSEATKRVHYVQRFREIYQLGCRKVREKSKKIIERIKLAVIIESLLIHFGSLYVYKRKGRKKLYLKNTKLGNIETQSVNIH